MPNVPAFATYNVNKLAHPALFQQCPASSLTASAMDPEDDRLDDIQVQRPSKKPRKGEHSLVKSEPDDIQVIIIDDSDTEDAKRSIRLKPEPESPDHHDDDYNDPDYTEQDTKPTKPSSAPSSTNKKPDVKPVKTTMIASFDESEMPEAPGPPVEDGQVDTDDIGLEGRSSSERRIIKMLRMAMHPDTPETEATQAMTIARRMLEKCNLDEVELRSAAEKTTSTTLATGLVEVRLTMRATGKKVPMTEWILDLAQCVGRNFGIGQFYQSFNGYYSSKPLGKSSVTFYGLKKNCQLAAFGFTTYFERIHRLCMDFHVTKEQYERSKESKWYMMSRGGYTRMSKRSYCEGAVARLSESVNKAIFERQKAREKAEQERRKRKERYEKALRRGTEQCAPYDKKKGKKKEEGDVVKKEQDILERSSADQCTPGDEKKKEKDEEEMVKKEEAVLVVDDGDHDDYYEGGQWTSEDLKQMAEDRKKEDAAEEREMSLVTLTEEAPKKALEEAGIKLSSAKRRASTTFSNADAHRKGHADASSFDLNRQVICG